MFHKDYSNFVRPASPTENVNKCLFQSNTRLSGKEAKRIYLEEVNKASDASQPASNACSNLNSKEHKRPAKRKRDETHFSDKDLFLAAQNNDLQTIKDGLDSCPHKISVIDDYGWSLLMIACQANSVDIVKELLKRGVDTTVRDKAGNSAQSLVIRNKNFVLADILVTAKRKKEEQLKKKKIKHQVRLKEFHCSVCNQIYPDEQEHISSTVHNLNASKGKKIPTHYAIPQTNRGYQIMLRVGWDRESGLGPEGAGNKYPIKAVLKKDRKGLGNKQKESENTEDKVRHINRKTVAREYESSKNMEINFRREFY